MLKMVFCARLHQPIRFVNPFGAKTEILDENKIP